VVTFLFTNIEGSTRRWESDADAMRAALLAHDEVLRTAIEAHDGFLFSHTGDGVVAAFASPKAAVNAADRAAVPDAEAAVLFSTRQPGKSLAGIASVRRWPR
jgi:class 3 adenylate cyclase